MNFRAFFLTSLALVCGMSAAMALDIILPTENDAIFKDRPEEFYMYVNRYTADGVKTMPWEGGQYGFVRTPIKTADGQTIYTRFHGGIDIKPLYRDLKGNPLDRIHAIAAGRVVHTNPDARGSNFGRYLVIEHQWDGSPYYSLYAHLSEIYVQPGKEVAQGDKIAMMGYTGRGIDRERSHLHLEVGLMLNENFDGFAKTQWGESGNRHGAFNGINLTGIDVTRLYKEARQNPKLTIPEFLAKEEPFFQVDLPGTHPVDMLKRYPWLLAGEAAKGDEQPGGWRITFNPIGIPLKVERLGEAVTAATVKVLKETDLPLRHLTYGLITGKGSAVALTDRGQRLLSLLTYVPQPVNPAIAADGANPAQPLPLAQKTHTVKKGETLIGIASEYKVGATELKEANKIKDPRMLQIGQVLVIPGASPEAKANTGAGEQGGE